MSQIIIGYTAEGTTDIRFLSNVIQRTFIDIGFECRKEIEVVEPIIYVPKGAEATFLEQILECCKSADQKGAMVFCIHVDADDKSDKNVFDTRMTPVLDHIEMEQSGVCKNIVPIIPVHMTESWMLADTELLKNEIGTDLSDVTLKLNRNPETIAKPKAVIIEAIRIARESLAKKRRHELTISELYQPIGQKISLEALSALTSFNKFKEAVREVYRKLNYLQ